jgi:hypothetical protein
MDAGWGRGGTREEAGPLAEIRERQRREESWRTSPISAAAPKVSNESKTSDRGGRRGTGFVSS